MYGSIKIKDKDGKEVIWLWDYKNEKCRIKSEMTKEEITESEKSKWKKLENKNNH